MKTAIVIGATGLIGRDLTQILLNDDRYSKVKIFVRRKSGINHSKLEEHVVDFNLISEWDEKISGDELFSAMGTTIRKAGSKGAQYKIDFTYQFKFAEAASRNGIDNYFLVSSAGANTASKNFYLKIKGELEEKISALPFRKISVFQPSLLTGEREETRVVEKIAFVLIIFLLKIIPFLKKYRPISGHAVAQAMIRSANSDSKERIQKYALNEIFQLT